MDYHVSKHASYQFSLRNINLIVVTDILENPDRIIKQETCKHIYQKGIVENDKKYLYRIFVNVCKEPPLIITGYKTSKIEKYEN